MSHCYSIARLSLTSCSLSLCIVVAWVLGAQAVAVCYSVGLPIVARPDPAALVPGAPVDGAAKVAAGEPFAFTTVEVHRSTPAQFLALSYDAKSACLLLPVLSFQTVVVKEDEEPATYYCLADGRGWVCDSFTTSGAVGPYAPAEAAEPVASSEAAVNEKNAAPEAEAPSTERARITVLADTPLSVRCCEATSCRLVTRHPQQAQVAPLR